MDAVRYVARWLFRFIVVWVVDAISLLVTTLIVPGMALKADGGEGILVTAAAAAFMLGIINLLVRPLILLLTLPLGFLVTFVVGLLINAVTLLITAWLLPVLVVSGFLAASLGGLVLAAVNTVITGVLTVDDEDSFYQGVVERLAKRQVFRGASEPGRGLVMMEIDGLSYWHMQHALKEGMLPILKQMVAEDGYVLSRVDCGLPSQTSACQAGIMFGDNFDIPAFRWYDKDRQKLLVSGSDASELNARYAQGSGLMRGGSSINNMLNGDAEKSILTLADLTSGSDEEKSRRASDIYLLAANPYFLMRTVVLMFGDALLEVFQYLRACLRNTQPRLDRLRHFYPLIRAATTVFMRDVAAYLTALDIVRGAPSIYVTWPGYDEVAHHSGPWSGDAFGVLKKYDRVIRRTRELIRSKAPRPYDLIVLSDHGQSFGATFKQRYGYTLKEFIEQHLPKGTSVSQQMGGDTGVISLAAVSGELSNVQQQGVSGRVGGAVVKQGQKAAQRAVQERDDKEGGEAAAQVVAYGSGNLAQVYFHLYPRKISLPELDSAYPGMLDALVAHEGIGIVVGYEAATGGGADAVGGPVVLGKAGKRNLHTGQVTGEDPLKPYGDAELRAWQVQRVMDFPHAGDLMVVSTVYPDGTVAALEELIGSHGGMGGEQTDAFLFHPADMSVWETRNSTDVFHILNARRGQPAPEPLPVTVVEPEGGRVWEAANLSRGLLRQPSRWAGLALRCLVLDRSAFKTVVSDGSLTAPALLIAGTGLAISSAFGPQGWGLADFLQRIGGWLVGVLALFGAARVLGGRESYTTTLRAAGFASVTWFAGVLEVFPALAPVARAVATALAFLAIWMGMAEAHKLRGWRGLLLPLAYMAVIVVSVVLLTALLAGAGLSMVTLAAELGLTR